MSDKATALEIVLDHERCRFRVESIRILLDESLGQIVDVLGQPVVKVFNDLQTLLRLLEYSAAFATEES